MSGTRDGARADLSPATPLQLLAYRVWGVLPKRVTRLLVGIGSSNFVLGSQPIVQRADGRILLVRHTYGRGWSTPGGFVDRGEHPVDGAVREVREEVGLEVVVTGEAITFFEIGRRLVQVVVPMVPVSEEAAEAVRPTSPEIADVRWFRLDALPEMQPEVAEAVERHFASGEGRFGVSFRPPGA